MKTYVKSRLVRNIFISLTLFLVAAFLLKESAAEFWTDETEQYRKLEEAQYVPELTANDLSKKGKIGLLLFGDSGWGNEDQHAVAEGMWASCKRNPCDLAIGLGDNIYPSGVTSSSDPMWQLSFESPYKKFVEAAAPDFWMLVGNHDRRSSIDAQLRYTEQSPIWKMPAQDYAIPGLPGWLNIYVLDTTFIAQGADVPTFQSAFEESFEAQLKRASVHLCDKPGWRILATHHPLISNGDPKNRFRENNVHDALHPFIEHCGIHLVLSGHEHMQQHVEMEGVDYLIQGAASATRAYAKPLQHDTALSRYLGYQLGFSYLSFTKRKMFLQFKDQEGSTLHVSTLKRLDFERRRKQASKRFE
ncbi:MAG: metallophosphoesterase [Halioglobus sp.]